MMIESPQFGYTPENLKCLRQSYGITQQRMAELLDTNISTARRWETAINRASHATMPYIKWVEKGCLKFRRPFVYFTATPPRRMPATPSNRRLARLRFLPVLHIQPRSV